MGENIVCGGPNGAFCRGWTAYRMLLLTSMLTHTYDRLGLTETTGKRQVKKYYKTKKKRVLHLLITHGEF